MKEEHVDTEHLANVLLYGALRLRKSAHWRQFDRERSAEDYIEMLVYEEERRPGVTD